MAMVDQEQNMSDSVKDKIRKADHSNDESDNYNWLNGIKDELYNNKVSKPKIAKLTFDDAY
jgi:hypothetical protein